MARRFTLHLLQDNHFSFKDTHRLKMKGWEKSISSKWKPILILEKLDFKPKMLKRDKEGHYIMTVGLIHQEDITVVIYLHSISEHLNILSKYQQI